MKTTFKHRIVSTLLLGGAVALAACEPTTFSVDLKVQGPGRVRSNPEGISCTEGGGACEAELGRSYILSAEPAAGAAFEAWLGDERCMRTTRPTIIVSEALDHDLVCTAVFHVDLNQGEPPNAL